jgi:hypothetical protein
MELAAAMETATDSLQPEQVAKKRQCRCSHELALARTPRLAAPMSKRAIDIR